MLSNLLIRNYALIRHLEMQPAKGFNIITGETGAGKSIMLGAVGLLLGNRADSKVLWQKEGKCVIEGSFHIGDYSLKELFAAHDWDYEQETIIRREISASGKSRAFVNDSPVTLDALRSLGRHLLDVHSQHDTLQLGAQKFQLNVLDLFAQNQELKDSYQQQYRRWKTAIKEKDLIQEQARNQQKESDYRSFLLEELTAAQLQPQEQEELENALRVMEHAEEIKMQLSSCIQALDQSDGNVNEQLSMVDRLLEKICHYTREYQDLKSRLHSTLIELQDISQEINNLEQQVHYDPQEIEERKTRLDLIYRLQQKHQVHTVEQLIEIQTSLENQALELSDLQVKLKAMDKEIGLAEKQLTISGSELSQSRKQIFKPFEERIEYLLSQLGIPNVELIISHEETAPGEDGFDQIVWLFSANKGIAPKPLKEVASGGEYSRLMFCVKYILADKVNLPTILFDEIDSGVSGEIALQMVRMMQEMSRSHQVITISHLPQFAAKGDHHYYVYKESSGKTSTSNIKRLEGEDRVLSIAKMLGGNNPSEIAFANAKELLEPSN